MTPTEAVALTRYVKAGCPQQAIDEYTPDVWYDLLSDLPLADCQAAAAEVARRQPFVAPAEIRAEVRRIRNDRLAREIVAAPSPELTDDPGCYRTELNAGIRRIADARSVRKAIAGPVREDPPPQEFTEAREALGPALPRSLQELARHQAAESRAEREARDATGQPPGETA
jgi:hypothetical protein